MQPNDRNRISQLGGRWVNHHVVGMSRAPQDNCDSANGGSR
ncbi:MAG: hypothetical protein AAFW95_16105 [Cyanobacteria bacterium J06638_6]